MKDALQTFARYNRSANAALTAILGAQDEGALREDQGSFFKTVVATFEHLVGAEISWLKRYAGFFPGSLLDGKSLVVADMEATKARMASGVKELIAISAEIDEVLVAFVDAVTEAQLNTKVKYKNIRGEEFERTFWILLFHLLNHGTHHRGEISVLLDRKGIKNDYSGFYNYIS